LRNADRRSAVGLTLRYRFLEVWFRAMNAYTVNRVVGIENLPPKGQGYVAAANHRSFADGLVMPQILVTARKEAVHMVSYAKIFNVPFIGTILRWAEGLKLDSSSREGIEAFFRDAKRVLVEKHECVGLHPEAHVQPGKKPTLGKGRTGAAQLAIETGCPVVPIGLLGTDRIWNQSTWTLSYERRCTDVVIGRPIYFEAYAKAYEKGDDRARKEILAGLTTIIMLEIARLTGQRYPFGERALAGLGKYADRAA